MFLGFHTQLETLMTIMNTINQAIKYSFTYSKQAIFFLAVQVYLVESKKLKRKLYKKIHSLRDTTSTPTTHSAVKKVSFIHKHFDTT